MSSSPALIASHSPSHALSLYSIHALRVCNQLRDPCCYKYKQRSSEILVDAQLVIETRRRRRRRYAPLTP